MGAECRGDRGRELSEREHFGGSGEWRGGWRAWDGEGWCYRYLYGGDVKEGLVGGMGSVIVG